MLMPVCCRWEAETGCYWNHGSSAFSIPLKPHRCGLRVVVRATLRERGGER
jgi:hypothetical protein